ncbi:type IV pilus twitching motility protein PilT [Patescibacteria group bacterium]
MFESTQLELEQYFSAVLEKNASDIFLTAGRPPILRVNKELLELSEAKLMTNDGVKAILEAMVDEDLLKLFYANKELDFSYQYKEIARFRVNAYFQSGKIALSMRNIPQKIRTLEELNLPGTIKSFATIRQGLVLFASPTGSGKTTTITALIDYINHTQHKHIITIENPIEYIFQDDRSFIEQQAVGYDVHSFEQGLESSVKSVPDYVMIGDIKTPDILEKTILVAESGHVVIASLNTSYATETVNWIIGLFKTSRQPEIQTRLANVLTGIVTQRLIPSIDERMVPAVEILIGSQAARNLIREGKTYQLDDVIATGIGEGMISLDRSLVELVKNGIIAKEEAINHVKDIPTFESLLQS